MIDIFATFLLKARYISDFCIPSENKFDTKILILSHYVQIRWLSTIRIKMFGVSENAVLSPY